MKYKMITEYYSDLFENKINEYFDKGYKFNGELKIFNNAGTTIFCREMIKNEQEQLKLPF